MSVINASFWERASFNRYGIMAITSTLHCCLGAMAALFLLGMENMDYTAPLAMVTGFTMAANSTAIAMSPIKWMVGSSAVAVVFSLLCIVLALVIG